MKFIVVIMMLTFLSGTVLPKAMAETSVDISNNGEGSSSEVHVENSVGESTVCVNGNCSTTQNGGNSTTVCINGKCETTQDGNIEKNEGGAKVSVKQNSSTQQNSTLLPSKQASESGEASDSAKKSELKHPSTGRRSSEEGSGQEKQSAFESWMNSIRNFFSELFFQNK